MNDSRTGRLNAALEGRYSIEGELGEGERFLVVTRPPERAPRRVVVVTGFFEELRRRMGG